MNLQEHLELYDLPKDLEQKIKKAWENDRMNEPTYVQAMKELFPEHSAEIKNIAKSAKDTQGGKLQYAMEGIDKDSKTDVADKYADYLVNQGTVQPVVIDNTTIFYEFDPETKRWSHVPIQMLRKRITKDLKKEPFNINVTDYMKNEFESSLKDHPNYVDFENFGLKENQLLLKNGKIIDLEEPIGELDKSDRSAKKEDYALNGVNAELKPDLWHEYDVLIDDFIAETIPDDDERRALQQFLGYCLAWPSDQYQSALLLIGPTDSGKSTLLKVFKEFFKHSNVSSVSMPQIGQQNAHHVSKLKESVINIDQDMADQNIQSKHRIKKAVGKEEIYADPKHEDGYEMKPVANFMMASNHPPDFSDADEAFLNRFLTIEAPNTISDEDKDRDLLDKLTTEKCLNWLLLWAIDGYEDLMTEGSFAVNRGPDETKMFWSHYGDEVHQFINQNVERGTDESGNVTTQDVYDVYKGWCEDNYEEAKSFQKFVVSAQEHPIMVKRRAVPQDVVGGGRRQCFIDIEVDAPL